MPDVNIQTQAESLPIFPAAYLLPDPYLSKPVPRENSGGFSVVRL
jgi:hypothetical protein